jgi:hypothetical protein
VSRETGRTCWKGGPFWLVMLTPIIRFGSETSAKSSSRPTKPVYAPTDAGRSITAPSNARLPRTVTTSAASRRSDSRGRGVMLANISRPWSFMVITSVETFQIGSDSPGRRVRPAAEESSRSVIAPLIPACAFPASWDSKFSVIEVNENSTAGTAARGIRLRIGVLTVASTAPALIHQGRSTSTWCAVITQRERLPSVRIEE